MESKYQINSNSFQKTIIKATNLLPNSILFLIILFHFCYITQSVTTAANSFYDYQPPLIESGRITFDKGTLIDNDPSIILNSTYTVNLQRMSNLSPTSYIVTIGYKHLYVDVATYPGGSILYMIYVQNRTSTNFGLLTYSSYDLFFTQYQTCYIAISKLVGNFYYFELSCLVNDTLVYPAYKDFTFTNTGIKQIGKSYNHVLSIYQFNIGYQTGATVHFMVAYLIPNTTNLYTIRLYTHGLYVYSIGVEGLIMDPGMINNYKLKNVILKYVYTSTDPTGAYFYDTILSYPGITITPSNAFFGLYFFYTSNNKIQYQVNLVSSQVKLTKLITIPSMGIQIVVFFRNHCDNLFYYDQVNERCMVCPDYCLECDGIKCVKCSQNFTISADQTKCECNLTIVSGICFQFNQNNLKGCTSATSVNSSVICQLCSFQQRLNLINNQCTCVQGYAFDANNNCVQICGDGQVYQDECDDKNTQNGDGCDDSCKIQVGFVCNSLIQPSVCKSSQELYFQLDSILKNQDNSAIIKFKSALNLIFPLNSDYFIDSNNKKLFNIKLFNDSSSQIPNQQLQTSLISVQGDQITFRVDYSFTIQCIKAQLHLNFSQSKYTTQAGQFLFKTCGDNQPLVYSQYSSIFVTFQTLNMVIGAVLLVLFFISLCTPKYIGLQAITTIQLIYYSCLLVTDIQKFPIGFKAFSSLKTSTGYNELFSYTDILMVQDTGRKIKWMSLHKTIIENYNLSFVLLCISVFLMLISLAYRIMQQNKYDQRHSNYTKIQLQNIQSRLKLSLKINNSLYHFCNQISCWTVLQIISALSVQILLQNKYITILEENDFMKFRWFILFVSCVFIGMTAVNNFKNVLLSDLTWGKMCIKMCEIKYQQIYIIYLISIGTVILFLHQNIFFDIVPTSAIVLIIHLIYIVSLKLIDPYQFSLNIHSYGLFFSQFVYLLFLVFINAVNFLNIVNQLGTIIFVCLMLILSGIIIILTTVRLYYQYRYGQELQKKTQRKRQQEKGRKLYNDQSQIKKRMRKLQKMAKKNSNIAQKKKYQNKFIYQNQIRQELMNEQIQFINNRPSLNYQQKQQQYLKKYAEKPMMWLQKNNLQQYQKKAREQQLRRQQQKQLQKQRKSDPEYEQISRKLRKQFLQLSRQQRASRTQNN